MRSFHRGIGQAVCLLICLVLMGQSSAQTLDEQVILGQVDSLIALSRKAFREGDQGLANTLAARAQDLAAVNRENSPWPTFRHAPERPTCIGNSGNTDRLR